jgi:hypothetical protein
VSGIRPEVSGLSEIRPISGQATLPSPEIGPDGGVQNNLGQGCPPLPNARHLLFEHYFDTIFKRELSKKGDHGVRLEDKLLLKTLHARAGLVLHTRSQDRAGARPTLSPRELRAILEAILGEDGRSAEDAQAIAERMLRFASDRLVLLLRVTDGGYAFGDPIAPGVLRWRGPFRW